MHILKLSLITLIAIFPSVIFFPVSALTLYPDEQNILANSTHYIGLRANPPTATTVGMQLRLDVTGATVLDYQPPAGWLVIGTCPGGTTIAPTSVCVDMIKIPDYIEDNESLGVIIFAAGEQGSVEISKNSENAYLSDFNLIYDSGLAGSYPITDPGQVVQKFFIAALRKL